MDLTVILRNNVRELEQMNDELPLLKDAATGIHKGDFLSCKHSTVGYNGKHPEAALKHYNISCLDLLSQGDFSIHGAVAGIVRVGTKAEWAIAAASCISPGNAIVLRTRQEAEALYKGESSFCKGHTVIISVDQLPSLPVAQYEQPLNPGRPPFLPPERSGEGNQRNPSVSRR